MFSPKNIIILFIFSLHPIRIRIEIFGGWWSWSSVLRWSKWCFDEIFIDQLLEKWCTCSRMLLWQTNKVLRIRGCRNQGLVILGPSFSNKWSQMHGTIVQRFELLLIAAPLITMYPQNYPHEVWCSQTIAFQNISTHEGKIVWISAESVGGL